MDESSQQISGEFEELEPQVTSTDPNERKLARRLRIERRIQALKRQNEPEQVDEEEEKVKGLTQAQIDKSIEVLKKLLNEGEERVTNIRVANDYRETDRREAEGLNREKIIEALEEEAQLAEEAFKQISEKWLSILKLNDPLHINDRIIQQKEKCEELIRQKDGIIAMLKDEITAADKKFSIDQRKQIDDIYLLSDRIEKQISLTRRAYREQLKLIEESMQAERKIIMEANSKKWEELYKKRDQEEQINADKKAEQMEQFVNQMAELRRDFQEKYRETKIKLERDIDNLEQELEGIKALAILNSEKLDYNYQILKKREDENIIIKSQQKRRINKLQDIVNTLKRKISDYTEGTKQQIIKVSAEIVKLHQNILDIEAKADHFAEVNNTKFNQLWDMNIERVMQVTERILTIDKILHEQLLGIEWVDESGLYRKELRKENLPSYRNALQVLKDKAKESEPLKSVEFPKGKKTDLDPRQKAARQMLLKHLMKQLSDRAGFIIEDRLQQILEPYMDMEKTLVRMDNVFSALNITKDADIDELLEYFLPYTHCPLCSVEQDLDNFSLRSEEKEIEVHELNSNESVASQLAHSDESHKSSVSKTSDESRRVGEKEKPVHSLIPTCHLPGHAVTDIMHEVLEFQTTESETSVLSVEKQSPKHDLLNPLDNMPPQHAGRRSLQLEEYGVPVEDIVVEQKLSCQFQHPLVISSVYVLKALRHFVYNYYTPKPCLPTISQRLVRQRNTICRLVEENDIIMFWNQFKNIFTEENENVWNALSQGLTKYHSILKDRKLLHDEVVELRQQNQELRILLAKYNEDPDDPKLEPPCSFQRNTPPSARSRKL
ncbi:hypothetical protein WA026_010894 [Henosepilachna vigintioctopunctata]|uniref:Dynein regulatory complex protein 1 n=1 Tax=Henosepilachna vigintioctopunctata TaxID=420089 RepID=A0AAW1UWX6_9CUCU